MLSEELEIIIQRAFQLAKNKKHEFLTLEHLLVELCNDNDVLSLLKIKNIKASKIIENLNMYIENELVNIISEEKKLSQYPPLPLRGCLKERHNMYRARVKEK